MCQRLDERKLLLLELTLHLQQERLRLLYEAWLRPR